MFCLLCYTQSLGLACIQSSLAQLGIPLVDVVKVLVAVLLLGNVLFYEAKNQELSMQGADGKALTVSPHHVATLFTLPAIRQSCPQWPVFSVFSPSSSSKDSPSGHTPAIGERPYKHHVQPLP